jgi:hypothetical protein
MGGAHLALRHGTLAQVRDIERRFQESRANEGD